MDKYKQGVLQYAAGSSMLKYQLLNDHLKLEFLPEQKVNLFLNFETILNNLTTVRDITAMITFHKQSAVLDLESSILNLVAHYRSYFQRKGCQTKVFFYYTDLLAEEEQSMTLYNKFYRSYYKNHYLKNPAYKVVGELMTEIVIPEIELILSYVSGCYFLKSKSFDGSLIPLVIEKRYPADHNIIITSDIFDTLYFFYPQYKTIYLKRRYGNFKITSVVMEAAQSIITDHSVFDLQLFASELYYKMLLAVKGSKIRNIQSSKGFGYGKFLSVLKEGLDSGKVLKEFSSINSVIDLFPGQYQDELKQAAQCMDLQNQLNLLNETDFDFVCSQMIDRVDNASLEALNNQRFLDFPINLAGLLE